MVRRTVGQQTWLSYVGQPYVPIMIVGAQGCRTQESRTWFVGEQNSRTWLSYVGQLYFPIMIVGAQFCHIRRTVGHAVEEQDMVVLRRTDLLLQTMSYCLTSGKYHVLYSASQIIQFGTTFCCFLFKTLHIEIIDSTSYVIRVDGCLAKYGFHLNHQQWCYTCV